MKSILNITKRDFEVLLKILEKAEAPKNNCFVSYKEFDYDIKSFFRRITKLEAMKLITVQRELGMKNIYQLTDEGFMLIIKIKAVNLF